MDNCANHKLMKMKSIGFYDFNNDRIFKIYCVKTEQNKTKNKQTSKSKKNMAETKEAIHNSHMDCVGVKCFSPRLSCDLFRLMRNASFIFKSNLELALYNILKVSC